MKHLDPETGVVYLVGAGPGDPGLLTLRAADLLGRAEFVLYDRLVTPEVLALVAPGAEVKQVERASEDPGTRVASVVEELESALRRGARTVVRLKNGDPFVFGRGAEEVAALEERGVKVVVVPGVSSALAVPELAGVALTRRGVSSSFAIATGREARDGGIVQVRWRLLATAVDSIVVLMGVGSLRQITEELVAGGMDSSTPAAAFPRDGAPVWSTTGRLAEDAEKAGIKPPAVIAFGKVVGR
ncbi:MAG: uroporphyrinogen-III C-methyltransferase [Promethearchaeota archaeon]